MTTALGLNGYLAGFRSGTLYSGQFKNICVPVLNCSYCPGAFGSCPLALVQESVSSHLAARSSWFVFGFLALVGFLIGRLACGWLCPFGFIQDLLHKIPLPKIRLGRRFRWLEYLKYGILAIFVFLLPALAGYGLNRAAFCKYICPAEVLEANIPLMAVRPSMISALGFIFQWKLFFLAAILILAVFLFRPFCRFFCPLGAVYSLFNRISVFRLEADPARCTDCGLCAQRCPAGIAVAHDPDNRECILCGECLPCPQNALSLKKIGNGTAPSKTIGS